MRWLYNALTEELDGLLRCRCCEEFLFGANEVIIGFVGLVDLILTAPSNGQNGKSEKKRLQDDWVRLSFKCFWR